MHVIIDKFDFNMKQTHPKAERAQNKKKRKTKMANL